MIPVHVGVERNINNAVVNKLANPHKIRENASFSFSKNYSKNDFRSVLDHHIFKRKNKAKFNTYY